MSREKSIAVSVVEDGAIIEAPGAFSSDRQKLRDSLLSSRTRSSRGVIPFAAGVVAAESTYVTIVETSIDVRTQRIVVPSEVARSFVVDRLVKRCWGGPDLDLHPGPIPAMVFSEQSFGVRLETHLGPGDQLQLYVRNTTDRPEMFKAALLCGNSR